MKKGLFTILAMAISLAVYADNFTVDGIEYSVTSDNTISVFRGKSALVDVVIPAEIEYDGKTYSVTSIGEHAFEGCSKLSSISIPNSVTSIGDYAFRECYGLTSIIMPNSVTSIGNYAFSGCYRLTSVFISWIVTSIGEHAFDSCSKLSSISIPNSVTSIGDYAFRDCYGLTSVTLGNSVTTIGDEAFYQCRELTSIVIPNSVTSIGNEAFIGCSELESVTINSNDIVSNTASGRELSIIFGAQVKEYFIGNMVESIGECAFLGCSSLTSVNIPNSVTTIGEGAFAECGLTSVTIGNSVTSIGCGVFYGCESLRKITLPESLTYLGDGAFSSCASLEKISLPGKLERIENWTFSGCKNFAKIELPASISSIGANAFDGCTNLQEINLPSKLERIGDGAFSGCEKLTKIEIPSSVSAIGNAAFSNCENMMSISVSKDNMVYSDIDGVVYNKEQNKIMIYPSGREGLFVIPKSATVIGAYAFSNCTRMSGVEIPHSVKDIEESAFSGCTGLTNIVIPNSVTTIGKVAFMGCSGLTNIILSSSLGQIGERAFFMGGHGRIETIVSMSINAPGMGPSVFESETTQTATLMVPKAALAKYREADIWKNFNNITSLPVLLAIIEGEGGTMTVNGNVIEQQTVEIGVGLFEDVVVRFTPEKGYVLNSVMCNGQEMISEVRGDSLLLPIGSDDVELRVGFANNYLEVKDIETTQRKRFVLPVELQNAASITAAQFDLVLPEGFVILKDKDGMEMIEVSERTTQRRHSVATNTQEDGSIRVACTSMSNATFADNSGTILSIHLQLMDRVEAGNYTIVLKNVLLSDASSQSYTMPYTECNVIVNEGEIIMGDVNFDEMINVGDIPALVSFILGNARETFVFKAADFNADNDVRVDDYVSLVNLILGGANTRPYVANRMPHHVDDGDKVSLQVDPISMKPGEKKYITVNLNNEGDRFTALQFDMILPEGISVATEFGDYIVDLGSRTSNRNHNISGKYQADGSFRVVCGSQSNAEFAGESGDIVKVMVEADASMSDGFYSLEFKNITVARTDATSEICENFKTAITVGEPDGITIPYVDGDEGSWYSLEGKRSERKPMQQGIYVKDGKKLLIK